MRYLCRGTRTIVERIEFEIDADDDEAAWDKALEYVEKHAKSEEWTVDEGQYPDERIDDVVADPVQDGGVRRG